MNNLLAPPTAPGRYAQSTELEKRAKEADARPTLLIADDDPLVRSVLGSQLQEDFRLIGIAGDATEAIMLAEEQQPDAALIDVQMPGGGARVAVAEITVCSPGTCLVILSGDERHDAVVEIINAGAVAYIRKGVPASAVARTLLDALAYGPYQRLDAC
jgi:DNA-binding NarL/FixJ family response regulator